MPELSTLAREGRQRIMRKYYGDGRWGYPDHTPRPTWFNGWLITKTRPKGTVWATSARGRKTHAAKYQIRAVHTSGHVETLTTWQCGGHTNSPLTIIETPSKVCSGCKSKVDGQPPEVSLRA